MTTKYTILLQNHHGEQGQYGIFTQPPEIDTGAEVYSNVWISSKIPVNGTYKVVTDVDYYAWVGTTPASPSPGVVIETGDSAQVVLGTDTSPGTTIPMVVDNGVVSLEADQETRTAIAGAFEIDTGTDFHTPNDTYLLGLGKLNSAGIVAPTAFILADNNSATNISPVVKFYVATSAYHAGTIVNFSVATRNAGLVDFTSREAGGRTTALVTHKDDGSFDVAYQDSAHTARILARNAARNKALAVSDGEKLRQLQSHLHGLYALLGRLGLGMPLEDQDSWAWIGTVGWPAATTMAVVVAGATYIANALIKAGYRCKHTEATKPDGTKISTFDIGPNTVDLPGDGDIKADWISAVAADKQSDGHKNLGLSPFHSRGQKMFRGFQNGKSHGGDRMVALTPFEEF